MHFEGASCAVCAVWARGAFMPDWLRMMVRMNVAQKDHRVLSIRKGWPIVVFGY